MQSVFRIFSFIKRHLKGVVVLLILLLGIVTCLYDNGKDFKGREVEEELELTFSKEKEEEKVFNDKKEEAEEEFIIFDIKGAILNPGAYKLKKGNRIYDAIRVSGGLTKEGDTSLINLSKRLFDEMVIIVHTKDEVLNCTKDEAVVIYKEIPCVCPEIKNDGFIVESPIEKEGVIESDGKNEVNNLVSLNKASLEELMELPGIGEAKGKSIISYREENNGFKTIEELMNVKGIGEAAFEKLKDFITI